MGVNSVPGSLKGPSLDPISSAAQWTVANAALPNTANCLARIVATSNTVTAMVDVFARNFAVTRAPAVRTRIGKRQPSLPF
jgi:hypothetical protein